MCSMIIITYIKIFSINYKESFYMISIPRFIIIGRFCTIIIKMMNLIYYPSNS